MAASDLLLLSCEHAGNQVPPKYANWFSDAGEVLNSHRGYDIGAHQVALDMASRLAAPIFFSTTTRLLIDLNRSLDSNALFSEFVSAMALEERRLVIERFYTPYRKNITRVIACAIQSGHRVVHVGIHSFTDQLNGDDRAFDLSLLFDEARPEEAAFCRHWQQAMQRESPDYRYRLNQPYRGCDDGLTTTLRHTFRPNDYLGLEIEIRQGMLDNANVQQQVAELLGVGLRDAMAR